MRTGQCETGHVVIEDRACPLHRVVAVLAGGWEASRCMIRIRRPVKVGLMAADARRSKVFELPVHVTRRTGDIRMRPGQRKRRGRVVIKNRARPLDRRMAGLAGRGKARRAMGGLGGRIIGGLVAVIASRWRVGELTIHVTRSARDIRMRSGQREARQTMIELRPRPIHGRMAGIALEREIRGRMVGIGRPVIVAAMAIDTSLRRPGEPSTHVTTGAGRLGVLSGQGERSRAVIKLRTLPGLRRVAAFAR